MERRRSSKSFNQDDISTTALSTIKDKPSILVRNHPRLSESKKIDMADTIRKVKNEASFRSCMSIFVHSRTFTTFIFAIIIINTALLVLQTFESVAVRADWYFSVIDSVFLGIYILELVLKLYVLRRDYFRDNWNVLDFIIVIVNILDYILPLLFSTLASGKLVAFDILRMFKIFKAIRALRVLRAIRFMTNLQVIMNTCIQSVHSMGAIVGLMLLFMYMFAVIGRGMYAHADPTRFGSLWIALFTLFQLLTLDDWFFIYEDVVSADPYSSHIIIYLIAYIVIEYLIFLNLFVAVLVDNFQLTLYAAYGDPKDKTVKIEEDDTLYDLVNSGDDDSLFEGDNSKKKMPIEEAYPTANEWEKTTLKRFFQILPAIEYNMYVYQQQQTTLNLIVDLCAEQSERPTSL